jgi:hypothetical protein
MNWLPDLLYRLAAALLVLAAGAVAALVCVGGDWGMWAASWDAARWNQSFTSGVLIFTALALALGLSFMLKPLLPGPLSGIGFWLGKAFALFPVTCLTWSFLGWWIGQQGYPIWTLMPVTETGPESWAQWLWLWVPLLAMMLLPLTGQCLSLRLEKDPRSRDAGYSMLGLLALMSLLPLEDIFGIEGAGAAVVRAFRQSDAIARATSLWIITATAMYLAVCIAIPTRFWPKGVTGAAASTRFLIGAVLKLCGWLSLARFLVLGLGHDYGSVEMNEAFENPSSILGLGTAYMLPALAFWALGHLVQRRWRRT